MKASLFDRDSFQNFSTSARDQQVLRSLPDGRALGLSRQQEDEPAAFVNCHVQNQNLIIRANSQVVTLSLRTDVRRANIYLGFRFELAKQFAIPAIVLHQGR